MQRAGLAGGRAAIGLCALPLFFLIARQYLPGQTASQPEIPRITVDVNLVLVHATVRDRQGGFVSSLRKENFKVFEAGRAEAIRVLQDEDVPVAAGLIVDNSGSMGRKRKDVTAAALAFARASNPRDELFVVNFNERVSFGLQDTEAFSASAAKLEAALNGVPASGRTALYDAIDAGLAHLGKSSLEKKVLLVVSDGGDNASRHTLNQVLESAARSQAMIYAIGLFDENDPDRNPGVLKRLARVTGGESYLPAETSQVAPICERIAQEIRHQYAIGYVSSNQKLDNSFRTIQVVAKGPHGEKLLVRTRSGYIASPKLP